MAAQTKTVLLIGATGALGALIAKALIKKGGANIRLLVRPGSESKLSSDVSAKCEIVQEEEDAFKDVYAVISAVQGGPETIVDQQIKWLRAAAAAGVRRFLPSDFSLNTYNLSDGEIVTCDHRRDFTRAAQKERGSVELVHILNGCFLDKGILYGFLPAISLARSEAYLWGSGDAKMDFTTYVDTASYTAEAALDDGNDDQKPLPEHFNVAGESLTFHELVTETSTAIGRPIAVKQMGSLADLDAEIDRRMQAEPNNMFAWLAYMYWRAMLNGKGKLGQPLMNERYPGVKPMGVIEYVKQMAKEEA